MYQIQKKLIVIYTQLKVLSCIRISTLLLEKCNSLKTDTNVKAWKILLQKVGESIARIQEVICLLAHPSKCWYYFYCGRESYQTQCTCEWADRTKRIRVCWELSWAFLVTITEQANGFWYYQIFLSQHMYTWSHGYMWILDSVPDYAYILILIPVRFYCLIPFQICTLQRSLSFCHFQIKFFFLSDIVLKKVDKPKLTLLIIIN